MQAQTAFKIIYTHNFGEGKSTQTFCHDAAAESPIIGFILNSDDKTLGKARQHIISIWFRDAGTKAGFLKQCHPNLNAEALNMMSKETEYGCHDKRMLTNSSLLIPIKQVANENTIIKLFAALAQINLYTNIKNILWQLSLSHSFNFFECQRYIDKLQISLAKGASFGFFEAIKNTYYTPIELGDVLSKYLDRQTAISLSNVSKKVNNAITAELDRSYRI